jgi:hypothetical protein
MGLFGNKPKVAACEMCGKSAADGCGASEKHVVEIEGEKPAWLPPQYRAQAQGEFTFLCTRCNAFPDIKWPKRGGASAGMTLHLGAHHNIGLLEAMPRSQQEFGMTGVR